MGMPGMMPGMGMTGMSGMPSFGGSGMPSMGGNMPTGGSRPQMGGMR